MASGLAGFRDREDAALQLADLLRSRVWHKPVVAAIPRGGVVIGAILARELPAELDVVLSRKLRAPYQPEYALGAVAETGEVILNPEAYQAPGLSEEYLAAEIQEQLRQIEQRSKLIRSIRPPVPVSGRSVIVTDDGIATGATMIAAIQTLRLQQPQEIVVAVPVSSPESLREIREHCDDAVALLTPPGFHAIGQFYDDFRQIEDDEMLRLLQRSQTSSS